MILWCVREQERSRTGPVLTPSHWATLIVAGLNCPRFLHGCFSFYFLKKKKSRFQIFWKTKSTSIHSTSPFLITACCLHGPSSCLLLMQWFLTAWNHTAAPFTHRHWMNTLVFFCFCFYKDKAAYIQISEGSFVHHLLPYIEARSIMTTAVDI